MTLGSSTLGNLTLGGSPGLGEVAEGTADLLALYRCDDGGAEKFGRHAAASNTFSTAGGIDSSAVLAPDAADAASPPPYTKDTTPHCSFDYTGAGLTVGDAGTVELWFRPTEFGDRHRVDGGVTTPRVDYEFFRLEQVGRSKVSFRAGTSDGGENVQTNQYQIAGQVPVLRAFFTPSSTTDTSDASAVSDYFAVGGGLGPVPNCEADHWYHLVFAWSQAQNTSIYVNGKKVFTWSQHPADALADCNISFGPCGGRYDLVGVVGRRLTDAEILARFNLGTSALAPTADTPGAVRLTNYYVAYAATYDSQARVTQQVREVLRAGTPVARVTQVSYEVLRSVSFSSLDRSLSQALALTQTAAGFTGTGVTDTGAATDALAYAQAASAHVVVVSARTVADALAFTQAARPTYEASAGDTLAFTGTVNAETTHRLSETLGFTGTAAFTMERDRRLLHNLAIAQSTALGADRGVTVTDTLTLAQTYPFGRLREVKLLQALDLGDSNGESVSHTYAGAGTDTLAFTEDAVILYGKEGGGSSQLVFVDSVALARVYRRSASQTLGFTESAPREPRTVVRGVTDRLAFFEGDVPTQLPLRVGGRPVVLSLPAARIVKVAKTVILRSDKGAVVLPAPEFGDADAGYDTVAVKRTMTGVFYTYVRTSPTRTLSYEFVLGRRKALELRRFVRDSLSRLVHLSNWKGELYAGQFLDNPVTFTTAGRYAAGGERVQVSLQFEGVKLN